MNTERAEIESELAAQHARSPRLLALHGEVFTLSERASGERRETLELLSIQLYDWIQDGVELSPEDEREIRARFGLEVSE